MKKLITITVLLALAMSGMAQQFSFSAVCESGQTLYYRITDAEAHTVILTHPYPQEGNPSFQGNYYEGYVKPAGEIIIPTVVTYNGTDYTVTAIDSNTFFECTGLTGTLDIPDGIVSIGEYAFLECGFSSISIHSSVCSIVLGAFANCRSIESITVDEENPTYYSENNAVIRREDKALVVGCKTTTIPDDIEIIGSYAFGGTGDGGDLVVPNSIRTIEEYAFMGCGFSGSIILSEALETIGKYAFSGGYFSGSLTIPNSVTEMGHNAFSYCQYLTGTLTLSSSLSTIDGSAFYNTHFTGTLSIPNSVKSIGGGAFCLNNFSELVLGDSLVTIVDAAFENCNNLTGTLRLPSSVTQIGSWAFCHTSFNEIYSPNKIPPTLGFNVFYEYDPNIPIHIPFGCTEAYQNAEGWNYFTNFIEEIPIIYREFDPPLEIVQNIYGPGQTLELDFDGDGVSDHRFYGESTDNLKWHEWDLLEVSLNGWETRLVGLDEIDPYTFDENDTIIPNAPNGWRHGSNHAYYYYPSLSANGIFHEHYGIHKVIEGRNYYGWYHGYGIEGSEYSGGPYLFKVYIDKIAFCTIPDYPLRWGQTSLNSIGLKCAEWYYEIQNLDGSITYQHLECVGDTLFDREGKRPKIIIRSNTQYDKDLNTEMTHEYVYEENGKVYWWNKDLEEFTVLYDLAANVGDEWEIKVGTESLTMHVDAVEHTEYEGHTYRTLRVSDENDLFSGDIVCGIGHLTSFFPERLMTQGKGYRVDGMRCYWVDGELAFKLGDDDCDKIYLNLHSGIEEDDPSTGSGAFMVYPNPANDVLFVETHGCASIPAGTEYRITNLMGQTVLSGLINAEKQQIDISRLPAGMYFINVGDGTRKFVAK